jgi:hypothetical protein
MPRSMHLYNPSSLGISAQVVDRVTAQRARVLVAGLEPLVQTCPVEKVLASTATFIGHPLIAADNAVADGTLRLALEGTNDVPLKGREAVNDASTL